MAGLRDQFGQDTACGLNIMTWEKDARKKIGSRPEEQHSLLEAAPAQVATRDRSLPYTRPRLDRRMRPCSLRMRVRCAPPRLKRTARRLVVFDSSPRGRS